MPASVEYAQLGVPRPARFRPVRFDLDIVGRSLRAAPEAAELLRQDVNLQARAPIVIDLPHPDAGVVSFEVVEHSIMAPELAARYPEIKTYRAIATDGTGAHARLSVTPDGFRAQVLDPDGTWYIDPYDANDPSLHSVYFARDHMNGEPFSCVTDGVVPPMAHALHDHDHDHGDLHDDSENFNQLSGSALRTYRIAISATGEYTAARGGTIPAALSSIVTTLNRVTGVYESELAISFTLIANNDILIFTDPNTDPFTNFDNLAMLSENQTTITNLIGAANYDIGHVFGTAGGGVASLGVVCRSDRKARGVSSGSNPTGDLFDVRLVSHEIGHQFGANHSWNGVSNACSDSNRNSPTAYEPGSGSTIMSYTGICGPDNVRNSPIPHFHSISYDEMRSYVEFGLGGGCAVLTSSGNTPPIVDAGPDFAIPVGTPFTLTAAGSDSDGETVTYSWEQRDLGVPATLSAPDNGNIPLFQAIAPSTSPSRTFPSQPAFLAGVLDPREKLPAVPRVMDFRVTARDGNPTAGGVAFDNMVVDVVGSDPFAVTSPDGGEEWVGTRTVTWDVVGTNAAPFNVSTVDIYLSTDGGQTYPFLLADDTPNDGSQSVSLPLVNTALARIKIEANDNIFFAVSPDNFELGSFPIVLEERQRQTLVPPGQVTQVSFAVLDGIELVDPTSPTLFVSTNGGPFVASPLIQIAGEWVGSLPAANCGENIRYYATAASQSGATDIFPSNAPGSPVASAVGVVEVFFEDSFASDLGWTVTTTATDGGWQRGQPQGNGRADPAADFDGNNLCYLTGIDPLDTNSDVDGGRTILTSPVFDFTGGGTLSYAYWFDDSAGVPIDLPDRYTVETSNDGGATWRTEVVYATTAISWRTDTRVISAANAGSNFRVRVTVSDEGDGSLVEGGFDAFEAIRAECIDGPIVCSADYNGDGLVNAFDPIALLRDIDSGSLLADYNNSGEADAADLLALILDAQAGCP
ncbi:MAG: reprolysin-like metallopeptidase [Planctomycetota bacterium]